MSETSENLKRERDSLGDLCCDRELVRNQWDYSEDKEESDRLQREIIRFDADIYSSRQKLWQLLVDRQAEIGGPLNKREMDAFIEYQDFKEIFEPYARNEREEIDIAIDETVRDLRFHERQNGLPRYHLPTPQFVTEPEAEATTGPQPLVPVPVVEMEIDDGPSGPGF